MQSNGVPQPSLEQNPDAQTSGRNCLFNLSNFLGFRTGSVFSTRRQQSPRPSRSSPTSPSNRYFTFLPFIHFSSLDGSGNSEGDNTFAFDYPQHRALNHIPSTPTMCTHYHSPSEASTRCPSPVVGDVGPSPLILEAVPSCLDEKAGPVTIVQPILEPKRRWNWRPFKGGKVTRSSPSLRPAIPINASPDPSKPSAINVVSPWDEPTPPPSIFPADTPGLGLIPIISTGSTISDDLNIMSTPKPVRRKSVNKLARTLGVFPRDIDTPSSRGNTNDSIGTSRQSTTRSRTKSLSLTIASLATPSILRPSPQPQPSRSGISLSTLNTTDDIHRFGLADDIFDDRSGSRTSLYSSSYSPISPITFNPPTPIAVKPPRRLPSADNVKLGEVTFASEPAHPRLESTLNRSRSLSFAPLRPRVGRFAQLANAHALDSGRPRTALDDTSGLPVRANWLEASTAVEREEASKARDFVDSHPEYAEEYKDWSGKWNQDNMDDVIRRLRALK